MSWMRSRGLYQGIKSFYALDDMLIFLCRHGQEWSKAYLPTVEVAGWDLQQTSVCLPIFFIFLCVLSMFQAFRDYTLINVTSTPAAITQCTSFEGATGECDTSLFQISNVTWENMTGSIAGTKLASLQCSGSAPCPGITIELSNIVTSTGAPGTISCSNVVNPTGFSC